MTGPDPLPPLEEPQPTRKLWLFVCDSENPSQASAYQQLGLAGNYPVSGWSPTWRRATPEDLEKLGYVRKPAP